MQNKLNMVVDVAAHAREHNIYFLCSTRGGKKGVVNGSTLGANEVAQMIIIDAVLTAIKEGIGWSLKATDVTEQLAQLSPNYVPQFMGGLVSLGLLDVTKDGNANVYRPNMEFEVPTEPLYIQLGPPVAYGVSQSGIKTGPSVVTSGNVFVVSPRDPFSRTEHPAANGVTNIFDGYWLIAYNFNEFITGKPVFVFASYDKAGESTRLRETWLAINNVDPAKIKDKVNIHHPNFWRVYSRDDLKSLGVLADHNIVKQTILGDDAKEVGVVVKDVAAPTSGSKVVDNEGVITTAPITRNVGIADDYVPRKPADFVRPSTPPSFERERVVTIKQQPRVVQPKHKVEPKVEAEVKITPVKVETKVKQQPKQTVPQVKPVQQEEPVINAKRAHNKSKLLCVVEEVISSALTPATKDAVLQAIVLAKAFNITNKGNVDFE